MNIAERLKVIILVGFPASGKTTWATAYYSNFNRLDGDFLKTSQKVAKALFQSLSENRNTIVDATNLTLERRAALVAEARKFHAQIYVVIFRLPILSCMERAKHRESQGGPHIPTIAFNMLKSKYVEPTLTEGFDLIVSVDP